MTFIINELGVDYYHNKNFYISRDEGLPFFLFVYFYDSIHLDYQNTKTITAPHTCILFTPGTKHHYCAPVTGLKNDWIHFSTTDSIHFLEQLEFPLNQPFVIDDPLFIRSHMERLDLEFWQQNAFWQQNSHFLLSSFFIELSRIYQTQQTNLFSAKKLNSLQRFKTLRMEIFSYPEKDWSIDKMCKMLSLSRSHFTALYKSFFNKTPIEDVTHSRLKKAKQLLCTSTLSVEEIACDVGYRDNFHFSRTFKKHTGLSPGKWRMLH